MFSKSCEYAIRSAIYITCETFKGNKSSIKDIASQINAPEAFTAKILQSLVKNKIINSSKGPTGGFFISEAKLENTKLSDIICAIDGDSAYKSCILGLTECSEDYPCPVHFQFKSIKNDLKIMLTTTFLKDLALKTNHGLTFLRT